MTINIDAPIHAAGPRVHRTAASTPVEQALALGETVVLWDGDRARLGYAAQSASTAQTAFAIRYSSGFLQLALPSPVCDRLLIPVTPSLPSRPSIEGYRQCIGIDAAQGVTTGISAADRARTARVLADARTVSEDLVRPGHLVVTAVDPGYSGERAVPRLALQLAATGQGGLVFADLVSEQHPAAMADEQEATSFALAQRLPLYAGATSTGVPSDVPRWTRPTVFASTAGSTRPNGGHRTLTPSSRSLQKGRNSHV
ncbi:3,4-dihydroxy-2-butanone-4-phosphate synthase [Rhodococcus sp. NPDC059968]|uniref:3,4-dihydroxy-2-butanone-4-phosphate synthase n=1 Tax=Rhodococcus sp. NPDC059968 TaxID=3347017 RepID=UPI003672EC3C